MFLKQSIEMELCFSYTFRNESVTAGERVTKEAAPGGGESEELVRSGQEKLNRASFDAGTFAGELADD